MKSEILVLVPADGDRRLWDLKRQVYEAGVWGALALPPYLEVIQPVPGDYSQVLPLEILGLRVDRGQLLADANGPQGQNLGAFVLGIFGADPWDTRTVDFTPFTMKKGRFMILTYEENNYEVEWSIKPFRPGRGHL